MQALPFVLGAASIYNNAQQNEMAGRRADNAQKGQDALIGRQTDLFDRLFSMVQDADAGGAFDPTKTLQQMDKDTAQYEARDSGNLAGALRTAGYRPGDSEIGNRLDSVKLKYREERERMGEEIRTGALRNKLAAYAGINPSGLNQGIAVMGQREANYRNQVQSPGGILQGLSPYLAGQPGEGHNPFKIRSPRLIKTWEQEAAGK